MKKLTTALLLVTASLFSVKSFACSYWIDELKQKNDLISATLSELQIPMEHWSLISKVEIADYKFWESKPTMMCPEEISTSATVSVSWNTIGATCTANVNVLKKQAFSAEAPEYSFDTQGKTCKSVTLPKTL